MKAKVIIENGTTEIVLTPDNEFEKDIIEKILDKEYKIINSEVDSDCRYGTHYKHKIVLHIEKVKQLEQTNI